MRNIIIFDQLNLHHRHFTHLNCIRDLLDNSTILTSVTSNSFNNYESKNQRIKVSIHYLIKFSILDQTNIENSTNLQLHAN